jgi:Carboxypeptidase regulatory-like domain
MIGRRSLRVVATALVIGLVAALSAEAQITTGTVAGTVKDAQGGVVPGATVVLTNEARGTKSAPAVTSTTGDFVFPNITAGTYTLEVTMPSFKTIKRTNVVVSPGSRVALDGLTLEVGGTTEVVEVKGEAPVIQANSGERSFTITTDSVENLPIANRSFTALTALTPGVSGNNRIGGGGGNNIMIDGVSAVDTGSNSILLQMNVESIAEVKVLTSG